MNDTIQTLADRLAEALHGNPTTIQTSHGLVILAAMPGEAASLVTPAAPAAEPAPAPVAVEEPKPVPVTSTELRHLARQVAAKIGADQTRALLGKSIADMTVSEAQTVAVALRAVLQ